MVRCRRPAIVLTVRHGTRGPAEAGVPRPRRSPRRRAGRAPGALGSARVGGLARDPRDPLHARGGGARGPPAGAPDLAREALGAARHPRGGARRAPRSHVRQGRRDGPRPSAHGSDELPALAAGGRVLRVLAHAGSRRHPEEADGRGAPRLHAPRPGVRARGVRTRHEGGAGARARGGDLGRPAPGRPRLGARDVGRGEGARLGGLALLLPPRGRAPGQGVRRADGDSAFP